MCHDMRNGRLLNTIALNTGGMMSRALTGLLTQLKTNIRRERQNIHYSTGAFDLHQGVNNVMSILKSRMVNHKSHSRLYQLGNLIKLTSIE